MTRVSVLISTTKDGSMYNRHDPADDSVIENRKQFLATHSIDIDDTTRVKVDYSGSDFTRYHLAQGSDKAKGMYDNELPAADALVTTESGHALMLPVADCVGAVFFDESHHVIMVSHLGRHSLEQMGGQKSIEYLVKHFKTDPGTLKVWLTPAPGKDVYPIWALDNKGMKEATFEQLLEAGVQQENIIDSPIDTDKDPNYFSYSEFLKGNRPIDGDHAIIAIMTD